MKEREELTLYKTAHSVQWSPLSGETAPTWVFVVAIVFLLIGLGALPGSVYFYVKEKQFEKMAVSAPGVVIDLIKKERRSDNNRRTLVYAPIVQFVDQNGNTQEYHSPHGSNPPDYKRGDKVMILYEPDNPEFAKMDDWQRYIWVIILGIFGIAFSLSSALMWWLVVRSRKQQR